MNFSGDDAKFSIEPEGLFLLHRRRPKTLINASFFYMFLKQVTINGFKSFADKTSLVFPKGITCIVGPNGCGKSNIVDSIRWVLGEQSAKALRGGKMQDVIFQGTDKRKPLQMCSVSLLFSDCEGQLGTEFNEVEITRSVSRDGGSDYYINGKAARLKDIQRLFMDTGVGRVSYSFMVQGQIDQILSSNPGERRAIFEEAAGITRYKTQRKEALNKLALVDQNLARVTDRIGEIERQIGSLRRQASKALRYKRLSHRLRHLDLAFNAKSYSDQTSSISSDERDFDARRAELLDFEKSLAVSEEELARLRTSRAQMSERLEQMRSAAAELRSMKEQAQMNGEFAQVRKRDLEQRSEQIGTELESLREQLESLEGRARGDEEVKQMQLDLVSGSDEVFKKQSEELSQIEASLVQAERDLAAFKQDLLVSEGAITRLRSRCTSLEVDLKSYQVRHSTAADSIFQLKEETAVLGRKIQETESALEAARERCAQAEADIYTAAENVNTLRSAYRDKQSQIQELDRTLASKSARLSLLNDFHERMEGFSEGVKAVLKGRISEFIDPQNTVVVSQCADVESGYEQAFEALMGSAIDAISMPAGGNLGGAIGAIKERSLGKACIQLEMPKDLSYDFSGVLPGGIRKVSDCIKASAGADANVAALLEKLSEGCYFCDDISAFVDFARESGIKFLLAVSKDGDMFSSKGLVYVSSGEKSDTESSFILRANEIKRLKQETEADNMRLTELNEEAMRINESLNAAEEESENRKNMLAECKREISSIGAQIEALRNSESEKNSELEKKSAVVREMENSRFEAEDKLKSAVAELEAAEKTVSEGKSGIEAREAAIAELRRQKDEKYSVLSETRLDLADKRARLQSLERGIGAIMEQQSETRILIEKRESERAAIAAQTAELDAQCLKDREQSERLAAELAESLSKIEDSRGALAECEKSVEEFEQSINAEREKHRVLAAACNEIEVRLTKLKSRRDYILERIRGEYDCDISSVDWKMELWKSDEEFEVKVNLDELDDGEVKAKSKRDRGEPTEADFAAMDSTDFSLVEAEVKDLRERIGAMGAVNLVAIEEYAELRERFDFLKTQSEDLWKSKNELVSAIDEINATSQKMFSETFEQIRKNFEFTFQKIFGGGTADLKLVENEDILDSGIEIIARPPSTVLKSLSLLSGGQRTMTAVSLLFAIYMVKPSPFCVLDELDAPLDDANIGRYTDMLREFTRYSQFLVISHNKHTVSVADTIYGVTQQERGVTKMVSMRFNKASSEVEASTEQP